MRLLSFNGESISEVFPIATHSFTIAAKAQNGHLEELTIQLPFPKELAYAKGAGKTAPLPTMATEYMEAHLMARITFPDNKQLSTIQSKGDVFFVTQVEDEVGRAPPLPVRYVDAVLLPEDDYMKL
ncbi:hypothetical protein AGDE_13583 [Angomonas deanei]|nr:hypothetical protein AGDE_13583 [Angomonas deanei]|eukprot:EPY22128.1 hypothetical protein AGDE_13583 [Angomonas deanei]